MSITVELYGIARARAGRERLEIEAKDLGSALRALETACPGLAPDVIANGRLTRHFLASRNGEAFLEDPATPLRPGETLLILSAQAGG